MLAERELLVKQMFNYYLSCSFIIITFYASFFFLNVVCHYFVFLESHEVTRRSVEHWTRVLTALG